MSPKVVEKMSYFASIFTARMQETFRLAIFSMMDVNKGAGGHTRWQSGPGQWCICTMFLGAAQQLVAAHFCCPFFGVYPLKVTVPLPNPQIGA